MENTGKTREPEYVFPSVTPTTPEEIRRAVRVWRAEQVQRLAEVELIETSPASPRPRGKNRENGRTVLQAAAS